MTNDLTMALIDMGLFWAFWHRSKDEPSGTAVNRFVGMVRSISLKHIRTIVLRDHETLLKRGIPGGEGYKQRPDKTPEERAEYDRTEKQIKELGIPIFGAEGYEADDLIGAWATEAAKAGWFVRIYSDDKDLEALVNGSITVHKRDREKGGSKDWTAEDVKARRGCAPARLPELLALMGDSTDKIPGVDGIGEEAAKVVLSAYPTVLAAYEDIGPDGLPGAVLPERTRKALKAGRAAFDLSLALVKLDPFAANSIDRALLEPPKIGPPPVAQPPQSEERRLVAVAKEQTQGDRVVKVLEEQPKPTSKEQEPPSVLDEIAESSRQKLAIENWAASFDRSLEPRTLTELQWLAAYLNGALVPGRGNDPPQRLFAKKGNEQALFAIMLKGRELSLPAMLSLAHIQIVEGKAEVDAMLMIALAIRSGVIEWFRFEETTDKRAVAICKHVKHPEPERMPFTIEQADTAGLGLRRDGTPDPYSPWQRWREVMLRWRASTLLLRSVAPEAVTGLWVTGEVSEMSEADVQRGIELEKKVMG